jgi:hypothetical protein
MFTPTVRAAGLVALFTTALAQAAQPPQAPAPIDRATMERQQAEANRLPDPVGTGPFPAMKEELASLPDHVVYRPRQLPSAQDRKLGVVVWGNGGCSDDGASSRFHLLELASHGYVVIANGRIHSGPGAAAAPPRPAPAPGQLPPARTRSTQLTEAIDWALRENLRAGSPYEGRIDPAQIAVSGWSCGGAQAIRAGTDPRVRTLVLHNTGILNNPPPTPMAEMDLAKDALKALRRPAIYILGGPADIAYENGMDDFRRIDHVPVAVANLPVGHGGTFLKPDGGEAAAVAVSWLAWQLRGDAQAARRFVGPDCGLCRDGAWQYQYKPVQRRITVDTLVDRAEIEELIVDYYAQLGRGAHDFSHWFAPDGILDVNGEVGQGRAGIEKIYRDTAARNGGPRTGTFRMLVSNLKIDVDGDRATAEMTWTGLESATVTARTEVVEQGREYSELVKRDGRWVFSYRVVTSDGGMHKALLRTYRAR